MMRTGRPGPVHFDMPYDLYMRTAPVTTPDPAAHGQPLNWRTTVADETVERALNLLASAQRPLILAGGGVRVGRAFDELKALAEQLDIPVYTSFMGKGALPPIIACISASPASGASFRRRRRRATLMSSWRSARASTIFTPARGCQGYVYNMPPTRLIQVDIDPEEIGRNLPVEIGMVGDAKAFLSQALRIARAKEHRASATAVVAQGDRGLAHGLAQFLRTVRARQRSADRTAADAWRT